MTGSHLSPDFKSLMDELLERRTKLASSLLDGIGHAEEGQAVQQVALVEQRILGGLEAADIDERDDDPWGGREAGNFGITSVRNSAGMG